MIKKKTKTSKLKISSISVTDSLLTSRGGLALFLRYLDSIGITDRLASLFNNLKGSGKGFKISSMFRQLFAYFADGTRLSLSHFDDLKKDPAYAAALELEFHELVSSHQVKRLFNKITQGRIYQLRKVFRELFLWRLQVTQPDTIYIMVDSSVLNNNHSKVKQGVQPTYKKVCGFKPLHFIWNGMIIDLVFRGGAKHCNHGNTVQKGINHLVKDIRKHYREDVEIVFLMDSGFFDGTLYNNIENIGAYYIGSGKFTPWMKKLIHLSLEENFKTFNGNHCSWKYEEFNFTCDSWQRKRKAIYTVQLQNETGQYVMEFGRKENLIVYHLPDEKYTPEKIIEFHHSRGEHELTHRKIKEFGTEHLPFKRFISNSVFYSLMAMTFLLFESFLQDAAKDVVPKNCYPTTARRIVIDFAARIIRHARNTILQVTRATADLLNIHKLWQRCNSPPLVIA